ncbi:transposase [Nocardia zapadnayensis]|uniref:RNA-guided endonuclease InsQ/TnpB family protein n=1 Tax=Nocardia rhamnosiphila TaxID=426716 RepID=UPI002245A276|nr:transposase [Nocardia zapadnayensis]MCX0275700.1 transposase [Nocardia zapadnayensis]
MGEVVRYTYRLRPGAVAERTLIDEWHRCRFLWNEAVHQQRAGSKPTFSRLSKMLTGARGRNAWLRSGSQVVQQQMLRTYAQALAHSFRVKGRGRPVVKTRKKALPSLEYTTRGFSIKEGRLCLAGKVSIPGVWSRELPSAPSSVRVYRDSLGYWYCSFVVRRDSEPLPEVVGVIGISKFLARSTMARKAADAAIGAAKRELIERATRAGRKVVKVPPAYTTMTCAGCGARAKQRLALQVRIFSCQDCGHTADRDRNAAAVILAATVELDRASADDIRHCGPPSGAVSGAVRAGNPTASTVGKS